MENNHDTWGAAARHKTSDAVIALTLEIEDILQRAGRQFSNDHIGFLSMLGGVITLEDTVQELKKIIVQELRIYEKMEEANK